MREILSRIFKCPACGRALRATEGSGSESGWECRRCCVVGREVGSSIVLLRPESKPGYFNPPQPSSMLRPWEALELIKRNRDGLILEIGAQDQERSYSNLLRLDLHRHIGTDVVTDNLEELPFADSSFDCVLALNSVEHVTDPFKHLREIRRVLKPAGCLLLDAAFIQPLHDSPRHYFNFTAHGLRVLLEGYNVHSIEPSPTQHPWYALMWLVTEYLNGLADRETRERAGKLTLAEVERRFSELRRRAEINFSEYRDIERLSRWWSEVNASQRDLVGDLGNLNSGAINSLAAGFRALATKEEGEAPWRGRLEEKRSALRSFFAQLRAADRKLDLGERLLLEQNDCSGHAGEIWGDRKVQQSFTCPGEICRIDIMFATFMRENNREISFRLWDGRERHRLLVEQAVNAGLLRDNQYFAFDFEPIGSRSGVFLVELESPQSYLNNSVTVRTSSDKKLNSEVFAVNSEEHPRDMTFRVYAQ